MSLYLAYQNACKRNTDIHEHLPTLLKYSQECNNLVEFGVCTGESSYALLYGLTLNKGDNSSKFHLAVDLEYCPINLTIKEFADKHSIKYNFIQSDSLKVDIPKTDMLFIDTWHIYGQLKRELEMNCDKVAKYIIMHDTTIDEWEGESIRRRWNIDHQQIQTGWPREEITTGLWPAVDEFLLNHPEWKLHERFTNNNGLTILKRVIPQPNFILSNSTTNEVKHHFVRILNNNSMYSLLASILYQNLKDSGICVELVDTINPQDSSCIYIFINSHELINDIEKLPPYYICYNFETIKEENVPFITLFKGAMQVWDFSFDNIKVLRDHGINAQYIPIAQTASLYLKNI